jgi:hypothetical protein
MSIKDLPGSFSLNVQILIAQSNNYSIDLGKASAGTEPPPLSRPSRGYYDNRGRYSFIVIGSGQAIASFQFWYNSYIKSVVAVPSGTIPTFNPIYTDTATWQSNFFIIRTQLVSVVAPGEQPVITALDNVWKNFQNITGKWGPPRIITSK